MIVFPPRNLPGGSVDWARRVEDEIRGLSQEATDVDNHLSNLSRSTGGSLSVISETIDELLNRSSEVIYPPSISVTGSATSPPFPFASQTVTFQPAPGTRSAFFSLQAFESFSPFVTTSTVLFVRFQGSQILRLPAMPNGLSGSDPTESVNQGYFSGFCRITTQNNVPPVFEIEYVRSGSSTASTATLSNISMTLMRS